MFKEISKYDGAEAYIVPEIKSAHSVNKYDAKPISISHAARNVTFSIVDKCYSF